MALSIPQLSYPLIPPPAFAGMLADSGPWDIESCVAEEALDAGLGLVRGTNGGATPGAKKPTVIGDLATLLGISKYEPAREPIPAIAPNRYAIGDVIAYVTMGRVWVQVDTTNGSALLDGGPVFLVYTGVDAGRFRADTGAGGVTAVLVPNARCRYGGTAGGVAMIKINLP